MKRGFVILDFGSQYTQLIARKLREQNYYCEIFAYNKSFEEIEALSPYGVILSGGPQSVNSEKAPKINLIELSKKFPLLGICYGMQHMAQAFGGEVVKAETKEYGLSSISWSTKIADVPASHNVWMSHGDSIKTMPSGFNVLATSENNHPAAMQKDSCLAYQFHPEVFHTEYGNKLLAYFAELSSAEKNWTSENILSELTDNVKKLVPAGEKVLCALSGGVDSTVVGVLLTKALGAENVNCVFVDTGLLRKNEVEEVKSIYKALNLNITVAEAADDFLGALKDVSDPEKKRKIIGHKFIDVFKEAIAGRDINWLAQGTLYPDVIESVSPNGESVTIKSHHNVGGLPKDLDLKLVEPLRELFKDEVREIGRKLEIPEQFLMRHPFPGPGLAIRCLGEITKKDIKTLKDCDAIYINALKEAGLYDKIWQAFCVLLPVQTVGVQGDERTYEKVLALRAVTSVDGMTADWFDFDKAFLRKVSNQITNEVPGVNRVVYDITSKPPGTIEWE